MLDDLKREIRSLGSDTTEHNEEVRVVCQSPKKRLDRELLRVIHSNVPMAQLQQQLKTLEMKLDTVTIKISETEENRKNYELNIAHLKEEEFERYFELETLRKQCAETTGTLHAHLCSMSACSSFSRVTQLQIL